MLTATSGTIIFEATYLAIWDCSIVMFTNRPMRAELRLTTFHIHRSLEKYAAGSPHRFLLVAMIQSCVLLGNTQPFLFTHASFAFVSFCQIAYRRFVTSRAKRLDRNAFHCFCQKQRKKSKRSIAWCYLDTTATSSRKKDTNRHPWNTFLVLGSKLTQNTSPAVIRLFRLICWFMYVSINLNYAVILNFIGASKDGDPVQKNIVCKSAIPGNI